MFSDIVEHPFYFISFQYLCEMDDNKWMPCEVGLIEWSMEHGITKTYQKFIEPGEWWGAGDMGEWWGQEIWVSGGAGDMGEWWGGQEIWVSGGGQEIWVSGGGRRYG